MSRQAKACDAHYLEDYRHRAPLRTDLEVGNLVLDVDDGHARHPGARNPVPHSLKHSTEPTHNVDRLVTRKATSLLEL